MVYTGWVLKFEKTFLKDIRKHYVNGEMVYTGWVLKFEMTFLKDIRKHCVNGEMVYYGLSVKVWKDFFSERHQESLILDRVSEELHVDRYYYNNNNYRENWDGCRNYYKHSSVGSTLNTYQTDHLESQLLIQVVGQRQTSRTTRAYFASSLSDWIDNLKDTMNTAPIKSQCTDEASFSLGVKFPFWQTT